MLVKFRYREDKKNYILDIDELNKLSTALSNFTLHPTDECNNQVLFETSISFFKWYIYYANSIINGKTISDKSICDNIFRDSFKNERQWKSYLFSCVVISKGYVEYLLNVITLENVLRFKGVIRELEIDLEDLIARFEVQYKKVVDGAYLKTWRRKNLSTRDIYSAARSIFFIEEFEKVDEIYLRDLKPVMMFQIRQILEVFGRNVLGYFSITDSNNNPIKKFTQVAWEFIKIEAKKPNSKIIFPFDFEIIISINKWSNIFVHTTYIFESYIQFFALRTIGLLFQSKNESIKIYTGEWSNRSDITDIKITDYNLLKKEFEIFIESKHMGAVVNWMDAKHVGAYIINL